MRIDPAYKTRLQHLGLNTAQQVLDRVDGRVVAWSRTTDTLHIAAADRAPGFFVKRYYYTNWSKRLRSALRGTFLGEHRGEAEFRLLNEMRRLGLPAVRPVACGARRVGHFVTACFLITEEVPDARNLTAFARDVATGAVPLPTATRVALTNSLARQVADLHAAGFAHGQLYWRNILLRFGPLGDPEFFFLDVRPRRGGRRFARNKRWWCYELANLAVSALPFTRRSDRMRFLTSYVGNRNLSPDIKSLIRLIEQQAAKRRTHEQQRIRKCALFSAWSNRLRAEPPLIDEPAEAAP